MSIFSFIGSIFSPAADLIDNLHTSDEEKMKLRNEFERMKFEMQAKTLEYETKLMETRGSIISAEAKSDHWLTATWRPIVMLTFTALVVARWMGWSAPDMPPGLEEKLFSIIQIGLGGYVVGRSGEKIAKVIKK